MADGLAWALADLLALVLSVSAFVFVALVHATVDPALRRPVGTRLTLVALAAFAVRSALSLGVLHVGGHAVAVTGAVGALALAVGIVAYHRESLQGSKAT